MVEQTLCFSLIMDPEGQMLIITSQYLLWELQWQLRHSHLKMMGITWSEATVTPKWTNPLEQKGFFLMPFCWRASGQEKVWSDSHHLNFCHWGQPHSPRKSWSVFSYRSGRERLILSSFPSTATLLTQRVHPITASPGDFAVFLNSSPILASNIFTSFMTL